MISVNKKYLKTNRVMKSLDVLLMYIFVTMVRRVAQEI